MRWLIGIVATLVVLTLVVVIVGYLLPKGHVATVTGRVLAPPAVVWDALIDQRSYAKWRPDVITVEILPAVGGAPTWREVGKNGSVTYRMETVDAPHRLVTRIADPGLPYGGTWEYRVEPDEGGTRVTITERGEVYNPIFRIVSRFFMRPSDSPARFLRNLGRVFGTDVRPQIMASAAGV